MYKTKNVVKNKIYFASSKTLYERKRYNQIVEHLEQTYPNSEIIAARGLYKDADDFYKKWSRIVKQITTLIFTDDNYHTIGYGVYQEIESAIANDVNVYFIDAQFNIIPISRLKITKLGDYDWTKYARIKVV